MDIIYLTIHFVVSKIKFYNLINAKINAINIIIIIVVAVYHVLSAVIQKFAKIPLNAIHVL